MIPTSMQTCWPVLVIFSASNYFLTESWIKCSCSLVRLTSDKLVYWLISSDLFKCGDFINSHPIFRKCPQLFKNLLKSGLDSYFLLGHHNRYTSLIIYIVFSSVPDGLHSIAALSVKFVLLLHITLRTELHVWIWIFII